MIAADPYQGGASWAVLQYILGLRELGHHVLFIEPIEPAKIRPAGSSLERSENAKYFAELASGIQLRESSALLTGSQTTVGLAYEKCFAFARDADVLINISGMLTDARLLEQIRVRAYL